MGGGEGLGIGAIYVFDVWRGIIFVDLFFFGGGGRGVFLLELKGTHIYVFSVTLKAGALQDW